MVKKNYSNNNTLHNIKKWYKMANFRVINHLIIIIIIILGWVALQSTACATTYKKTENGPLGWFSVCVIHSWYIAHLNMSAHNLSCPAFQTGRMRQVIAHWTNKSPLHSFLPLADVVAWILFTAALHNILRQYLSYRLFSICTFSPMTDCNIRMLYKRS